MLEWEDIMLVYIVLFYLCVKCAAPLWCYLLLLTGVIIDSVRLGFRIHEKK